MWKANDWCSYVLGPEVGEDRGYKARKRRNTVKQRKTMETAEQQSQTFSRNNVEEG